MSHVKDWFKGFLTSKFKTSVKAAYPTYNWNVDRIYIPVTDLGGQNYTYSVLNNSRYEEYRNSFWLQYSNPTIQTDEDLFQLTKLMGTPDAGSQDMVILQYGTGARGTFIGRSNFTKIGTLIGASDSKKKQLFNSLIKPKIQQAYTQVANDKIIDPIIKTLIKKWWADNNSKLHEFYLPIAEAALAQDDTWAGGFIIASPSGQIYPRFFTNILTVSTRYHDNVKILERLGLKAFLESLEDLLDTEVSSIEELEAYQKNNSEVFRDTIVAALEIEVDLTVADYNNLNQCALITGLISPEAHKAEWSFLNYIQNLKYGSPLGFGVNGSNRIYPVKIKNYNPNKLINNCVINKKVKNIFNSTDTKTPHNMVKGVFWVYEDNKGSLREAELSMNSTVHRKKISTILRAKTSGTGIDTDDTARFRTLDRTKDSSYYFLENTKINFDGTNPSTARSDVKVEMTWKLGSLEGLASTLAILGEADNLDPDTVIAIQNLITLPITKKPGMNNGPGEYLTNQYSPNYSRLRLKIAPYGDKGGDHQEDCMILDLAIIDHQINRSSETGETTLTINYRGYFEATMNMPFNDALASTKILKARETRQLEALTVLRNKGCKVDTVREAVRLEQEISRDEASKSSAGSILERLGRMQCIHEYYLDENKMLAGTFGNVLDGTKMYVDLVGYKSSGFPGALNRAGDTKVLAEALGEDGKIDADAVLDGGGDTVEAYMKVDKALSNKFFFLGDLMWALLDCLFETNKDTHRKATKNLNLRFLMGTIYVPNPEDLGGPPTAINPISIPVDLRFFVQWFHATVVSKGLTFYPVGTFIRDLIERMINDIIYDTCFSLLLPDENPPLLRSRTFVGNDGDWFKKAKDGYFDPNNPYTNRPPQNLLFKKSLVALSDPPDDGSWSNKIISKNYCVIYQQFPSYKRQLAAQDNGYLRDDEYTPTIYYGAKNKNYNFLSNVSFSKTNSPFLREARFFGSTTGGLSLLSNVYDLSFSFKNRKANTLFYPGCIINFVLLDWGQRWVDYPPWGTDANGPIHYFGQGDLGDSDPHENGTMSNIMGMGGYFIIKSVEYNLGQTPGEFEINISTKFLGTDGAKELARTLGDEPKLITDKADCVAAFNVIATRYNALVDADEGEGVMNPVRLAQTQEAATANAERASETRYGFADGYGQNNVTETPQILAYEDEDGTEWSWDPDTKVYVEVK